MYMITGALDLANLLIELPEEKANIGTCAIHTHVHKSICIHTQTEHTYTQAQAWGHREHAFTHGQEHVSVERPLLGEHYGYYGGECGYNKL